jgi:hypothetical protein
MKVYAWVGHRTEAGAPHYQTHEIVAAPSKAAAARAAGERDPRRLFNLGETGNAADIAVATREPGVVFWRPIDARESNDYRRAA